MAVALAKAAGAELSVLHVVDDHVQHLSGDWVPKHGGHAHTPEQRREIALAEAQEAIASIDVTAHVDAVIGDPGLQLRTLSESVDLIVVGSRRWGPLARLVTGGVGETLVADSSCSVLIVPRPEAHHHHPGHVHAS